MNAPAVLRCEGVTVVFEGVNRLSWRRVAAAQWAPTALWPDVSQAAELTRGICSREPLLVLIDRHAATVELMAEEFVAAPPRVAALAQNAEAEVVTLKIPFLDWLPEGLRTRGVEFAQWVAEQVAGTPKGLLPNLLLEPANETLPWLRFGCRLSGQAVLDVELIARHAFKAMRCSTLPHIDRQARAC